jgi:hypothetical protein
MIRSLAPSSPFSFEASSNHSSMVKLLLSGSNSDRRNDAHVVSDVGGVGAGVCAIRVPSVDVLGVGPAILDFRNSAIYSCWFAISVRRVSCQGTLFLFGGGRPGSSLSISTCSAWSSTGFSVGASGLRFLFASGITSAEGRLSKTKDTIPLLMLKINSTLTSLNTLFCFFEQEVLLTIVHIGTRRNNVVLPRFFARSPDGRSGWAVGSPRMLGRGKVGQPTTSRIGPKRG